MKTFVDELSNKIRVMFKWDHRSH